MGSRRRDISSGSGRKPEDDIRSKEEEQRRLNEELEAKLAKQLRETENFLRENEAIFSRKPSMLDNVELSTDCQFLEWESDAVAETKQSSRKVTTVATKKPQNSARVSAGQQRKTKTPTPRMSKPKTSHSTSAAIEILGEKDAGMDYEDDSRDYIQRAISNVDISQDRDYRQPETQVLGNIEPAVFNEMGSEAQIRILKAKLGVMHEQLGKLSHELGTKDESLREIQSKLKDTEEEKSRLQRSNTAQQAQIQKHKKLMDEAKERADSLDVQLTACKKELDATKKNQKQQATSQGTLEVRLNRALEECEKYKTQLEKVKSGTKESVEAERRRLEELTVENKRLEKQKNELMNGYKKQLKLIDILKRKQMHIEAAKMLSFTEEEFVKAMDWGNN